jgi:hypothetical protein
LRNEAPDKGTAASHGKSNRLQLGEFSPRCAATAPRQVRRRFT